MKHELQDKTLDILSSCHDMAIATIGPDGAPQTTVVSFVHDGLLIYFACGASSQKASNLAKDPRVSIAMTLPYRNWWAIQGLSMTATAEEVTVKGELDNIGKLMVERFPQIREIEMPEASEVKMFRVRPSVISVLDYSKGFGHTDLVSVAANDISETLDTMRHHWLVEVRD